MCDNVLLQGAMDEIQQASFDDASRRLHDSVNVDVSE